MKNKTSCVKCKGRLMCGLNYCPLFEKINIKNNINNKLSKEFKTNTPGIMIGWNNYPNVKAGILSPIEKTTKENPRHWVNNNTQINNIMSYCSKLINSRDNVNIKNLKGFNELIQQVALSSKPLEIDVSLKKIPEYKITYDIHAQPHGPTGEINKIILNDKPIIKKPVYKVSEDTDLNATDAITYLKKEKIEEYEISTLLSSGILGLGKNRKLVPTRWAITATDDTLGKQYLNQIRQNNTSEVYAVFHSRYLGNIFTIMLLPTNWSYELIELWQKGAVFSNEKTEIMTDYEEFTGRKTYAENTGGGYYASRLPILEWLVHNKLQASALVIRQITKDYYTPLGVWVVREAVRKALTNMKTFTNYSLAKLYTERLTGIDLRSTRTGKEKQETLKKFMQPLH